MTGLIVYVVKNKETGLFAGKTGNTWVADVRDALQFTKFAAARYAADVASVFLEQECEAETV